MPRDKSQSHIRIIEAAKKEFMEYGFTDASLRRIANEAGIQVSGLYKHFSNKEEMFAALVDPAIDGLMALYREIEKDNSDGLETEDKDSTWTDQKETVRTMEYIYDHIDEFRLVICRSQGTRYESFIREMAALEEEVMLQYLRERKKKGNNVKKVDRKEFHLLVTANVEAMFQAVVHDFSRKEAMHYAKTLEKFYMPAWSALFGF